MTIDNEKNKAFWDEAASRSRNGNIAYAGMLMEGREFEAIYRHKTECSHLLRIFQPGQETRVLEIGSGGGRWAYFLADKVSTYVGLDLSSEMVAGATAEAARRGLDNVTFVCDNLLSYETDATFDLIYFSGVLQYMDDTTVLECIAKATSLMSPEGVIVSRDSVQVAERVEKAGDYPVVYRTVAEYKRLFEEAGYAMDYTAESYPHKRFTGLASRLYLSPIGSYGLALVVREFLCVADQLLGSPGFLKTARHKQLMHEENPQEHRFFKYVRKS